MANGNDVFVDNLGDPATLARQLGVEDGSSGGLPQGSSAENSLTKVKQTSRDQQKVASVGPNQPITIQQTLPSNFLVRSSQFGEVDESTERTSDFYRDGDPTKSNFARFITPFEDEQASIRVVRNVESENPQDIIPRYTKFILESVQEQNQERVQIVETFGDFYTFFYGEKPPIYTFQGTLINTKNVNWVSDFMVTYEAFLRGTRCVEQRAQIILTYGGRQIQGFIMSTNNRTQAAADVGVPFGFQMVVTKRRFLGFSTDAGLVTSDGISSARDSTIAAVINSIAGPEGTGSSRPGVSQAHGVASGVVGDGAPSAGIVNTGNIVAR